MCVSLPGLCVHFCLQGGFLTRRTAVGCAAVAAVGLIGALAIKVLDTPSRPYDADANTVGNEYDAWTEVGEVVFGGRRVGWERLSGRIGWSADGGGGGRG